MSQSRHVSATKVGRFFGIARGSGYFCRKILQSMEKGANKQVIPDEVREHLTKDIVNFYLHEANMQLEDVYQASGKATERGYLFMSAVVALTCGCGWLISKADESVYMSLISITAIVSAILILFIMLQRSCPYIPYGPGARCRLNSTSKVT